MKAEERTIKASIYAGLIDIAFGLMMYFTGWHAWYFEHFHFFGIMGISMIVYGTCHYVLYEGL